MTHFVSYSALQSIFCSPVLGFLCLSFMACGFTIGIDSNPHLEDWQGMSNTFNLGGLAGEAPPLGTYGPWSGGPGVGRGRCPR